MTYQGARADRPAGRRMIAAVESTQGPRGEGRCAWPGCPEAWVQVDHVLARANGGGDEPENLQGLCAYHNAAKGDGSQTPKRAPAGGLGEPSRRWIR